MDDTLKRLGQELEEEVRPAPQLYAVTGDKQPPGYNWLSELEPGTIFYCRPFDYKGFDLSQFHVIYQGHRFTMLYRNINGEQYIPVDPVKFCAIMELIEKRTDLVNHEQYSGDQGSQ